MTGACCTSSRATSPTSRRPSRTRRARRSIRACSDARRMDRSIERPDDPQNEILAIDADSGKELWRISGADTKGYEGATLGRDRRPRGLCHRDGTRLSGPRDGQAALARRRPHRPQRTARASRSRSCSRIAPPISRIPRSSGHSAWPTARRSGRRPSRSIITRRRTCFWPTASSGRPPTTPRPGGPHRRWDSPAWASTASIPRPGSWSNSSIRPWPVPWAMTAATGTASRRSITSTPRPAAAISSGLSSASEFPNPWIRSTCGIGPLPCNGLYYAGPPSCACCNSVMLNGLNAMAAEPGFTKSDQPIDVASRSRARKRPRLLRRSRVRNLDSPIPRTIGPPTVTTTPGRERRRSQVPAVLAKRWETKLGTRASAPIIAGGHGVRGGR